MSTTNLTFDERMTLLEQAVVSIQNRVNSTGSIDELEAVRSEIFETLEEYKRRVASLEKNLVMINNIIDPPTRK